MISKVDAQRDLMGAMLRKVTPQSTDEVVASLMDVMVKAERPCFVVTANPEILINALKFDDLATMFVSDQTMITADGIGVVKARERLGLPVNGRVTGVELCSALFPEMDRKGLRLALFGAEESVLNALCAQLNDRYPRMKVVYAGHGYQTQPHREIMREIAQQKPDLILVALGSPAQERAVWENRDLLNHGVWIGVGGSFDVLSGFKKRAPEIFIRLNLEWLYRLAKEPKRIGRFIRSNLLFGIRLLRLKRRSPG